MRCGSPAVCSYENAGPIASSLPETIYRLYAAIAHDAQLTGQQHLALEAGFKYYLGCDPVYWVKLTEAQDYQDLRSVSIASCMRPI